MSAPVHVTENASTWKSGGKKYIQRSLYGENTTLKQNIECCIYRSVGYDIYKLYMQIFSSFAFLSFIVFFLNIFFVWNHISQPKYKICVFVTLEDLTTNIGKTADLIPRKITAEHVWLFHGYCGNV